jgi:amidohydrolase
MLTLVGLGLPEASRIANMRSVSHKELAARAIDTAADRLVGLSHDIHSHPELRFEEHRAAGWASALLEDLGFAVDRGIGGLDTAFQATAGDGELVVAMCAEYDALPEIGHACGHNLICASSIGAAVGLAAVARDLGVTVKVIGTPAEEGGGGKALLLEAGAFDGVHAALMAHPSPGGVDMVDMGPVTLASMSFEVEYTGRAAHAAGNPQDGINALDAAVIAQTAVGLLRQQLASGDLVHVVVRHGGDAANVIPERAVLAYVVRSETIERARILAGRVSRCFEAGALATGCEVEIRPQAPEYAHLEVDQVLSRLYADNVRALGRSPFAMPPGPRRGAMSTDMANVSLALPAIHPSFGVPGATVAPHHRDFADACATPESDDTLVLVAKALAWTGVDAATDPETRARLLRGERVL